MQLSPYQFTGGVEWLLLKIKGIPLADGSNGVILYQETVYLRPVGLESLDAEQVLESMSSAFYLLDDQLNFCFLNTAAETLLRCDREKAIGPNLLEVFPHLAGTKLHHIYAEVVEDRIMS